MSTSGPADLNDEKHFNTRMLQAALSCGVLAGMIFLPLASIDLAVSGWFYSEKGGFWASHSAIIGGFRRLLIWIFTAGCIYCLWGFLRAFTTGKAAHGAAVRGWLFFGVCLMVGPGLIANLLLKDQWGRARPRDIEAFGGGLDFTPAVLISNQCAHNCSFVSGESASIFMLFFALAFLFPSYRRQILVVALVLGGLAGLLRIAMGGHFLSDVIFSGIVMALVAALLHRLIVVWPMKDTNAL